MVFVYVCTVHGSRPSALCANCAPLYLQHLLRGKPRWQLFFAYLVITLVCWGLVVDLVAPQKHRDWPEDERSFATPLLRWGIMRPRKPKCGGRQRAHALSALRFPSPPPPPSCHSTA